MEELLIHMNVMRRVMPAELQHVLLHQDKAKGDEIWLLGTKGSKQRIDDLNKYTPERWQTFAQHGLVYVMWSQRWAFSPGLDEGDKLPVLMEPYDEAFSKLETAKAPKAAKAVQPTLLDKPAEQATTTTT